MKKILIASTALALTAGAAMADGVTISGYGRFGMVYNGGATGTASKTAMINRLRFTFNAKTTTDSGVEFGLQTRVQNDTGDSNSTFNNPYFYVSYQGLKVEVGNTETAYDSAYLLWDSEMGYRANSFGDPAEYTYYYDSKSPGSQSASSMGVYASYSVGDFVGQVSYINPDQFTKSSAQPAGTGKETGISLYYKAGQFSVAGAYTHSGLGISGNNPWFIGAAYAITDKATVGLNYIDEDSTALGASNPGKTTTLYGNYAMDAYTFRAYVAHNDRAANNTNNAFGLGVDYAMGGGTTVSAAVQRGYDSKAHVDIGAKFSF